MDEAFTYPKTTRVFYIYSFTAGTMVETDEGEKPIEEIKKGDKVFAEDPATGEQGYFEVVEVRSHPVEEILEITIDSVEDEGDNEEEQLNSSSDDEDDAEDAASSTMEVTPEHPIYVEGKGWLWAENLAVGDRLRRADGGYARVLAVERVELAEPKLVYNFTVKGPHTYFVLEVGVLVHNVDICGPYEGYVQYLEPYSRPKKLVVETIPDLYKKVPIEESSLPPGWKIVSETEFLPDDVYKHGFIETVVQYKDPNSTFAIAKHNK